MRREGRKEEEGILPNVLLNTRRGGARFTSRERDQRREEEKGKTEIKIALASLSLTNCNNRFFPSSFQTPFPMLIFFQVRHLIKKPEAPGDWSKHFSQQDLQRINRKKGT